MRTYNYIQNQNGEGEKFMDKDKMQINDEELNRVLGGMANPIYKEFEKDEDGNFIEKKTGKKFTEKEAWDQFRKAR